MSNQTVFDSVSEQELKTLYDDFLQSKEEGLRPRSFDPYLESFAGHSNDKNNSKSNDEF